MNTVTEKELYEILGDDHQMTAADTPLRPDAFVKTDAEKMTVIEYHFEQIMEALGLDLTDDSLRGTPHRVAKMYVQEIFSGLHPDNKPKISVFDNSYHYDKMLVEANINFNSTCEHHFLPIIGKAHIGYVSNGKVIGLSKLNRIVDYFARRPQVQERMVMQVFNELKAVLDTEDVMVVMEAKHLCVSSRGIKDETSFTSTLQYGGIFEKKEYRDDFFRLLGEKNS
ncbi:MAG: GTP cyclohydrolase I FolE [Flavobacterium sp.]|jgi:GTP cyclohydrolase I|uniref:GTP cyclohydrolase I FolE n=1 Tax=Flavobacterium sp. TaxID=239 RepID=UPI0022CA1065|nr:GTP cyclohydrolase I FolE [Flavobacterium sp.]MCZ8167682.1 GTP cyclohydrolase I FolE [Flavobacterium sp.]MCZ8295757.1 GTP cyclohydrolase I FolE [Flavobacterium sp.]